MSRSLAACLTLAAAAGCARGGPANTAEAVADRFVDLYFVEVDQARALPLAVGPARETLERELADVQGVRAGGGQPEAGRGSVYYRRTWSRVDPETGTARTVYDLTVEQGRDRTRRHALLSLRREQGRWRVGSFTLRDGAAPQAHP